MATALRETPAVRTNLVPAIQNCNDFRSHLHRRFIQLRAAIAAQRRNSAAHGDYRPVPVRYPKSIDTKPAPAFATCTWSREFLPAADNPIAHRLGDSSPRLSVDHPSVRSSRLSPLNIRTHTTAITATAPLVLDSSRPGLLCRNIWERFRPQIARVDASLALSAL